MVNLLSSSQPIMIYYDIETGRFSKDSDILQVAITRGNNTAEEDLNVFALSTKLIGDWAAELNGLSITYTKGKQEALDVLHIRPGSRLSKAFLLNFTERLRQFS